MRKIKHENILKELAEGISVEEICETYGIKAQTVYNIKNKAKEEPADKTVLDYNPDGSEMMSDEEYERINREEEQEELAKRIKTVREDKDNVYGDMERAECKYMCDYCGKPVCGHTRRCGFCFEPINWKGVLDNHPTKFICNRCGVFIGNIGENVDSCWNCGEVF